MDDLENRLSSVLGDPQQMEKITKLAQSILSGAGGSESAPGSEIPGFDPAMLGRLAGLMNREGGKEEKMLEAMSPYLSEKRRGKMNRALKIAKLARIAKLAMEEGEDHA